MKSIQVLPLLLLSLTKVVDLAAILLREQKGGGVLSSVFGDSEFWGHIKSHFSHPTFTEDPHRAQSPLSAKASFPFIGAVLSPNLVFPMGDKRDSLQTLWSLWIS